MLKPAYIYKDNLQKEYNKVIFNDRYKYYNNSNYWDYNFKLSEDSWNVIELVSVDTNDNIRGFFRAEVNRASNKISSLGVMNFHDKNVTFSKDFYQFFVDLFDTYKFRKIEFAVVIGNPAEKMYDKYMQRYGGSIVGTKRRTTILTDGQYYDLKMYEIFKEDWDRCKKS